MALRAPLICSVPFLFAAFLFLFAAFPFFICSVPFLVCSVLFLFAAFLFCLQRFFFCLQRFFYLQCVPCGPPYLTVRIRTNIFTQSAINRESALC